LGPDRYWRQEQHPQARKKSPPSRHDLPPDRRSWNDRRFSASVGRLFGKCLRPGL